MLGKRIRHISRYRVVASVMARHGFGFLVEEIGLRPMLSLPRRLFTAGGKKNDPKTIGQRIREVCEELGPTFVKMGQLASTRSDLIPEGIIQELVKLQDHVPPFSFTEVKHILEGELGTELENVFAKFEAEPLAAASIGQVHHAVLLNGEEVAVKVQRPQITTLIETDLEILMDLATLAEYRLEWAARYQLTEVVEEFSRSLRAEMDYSVEGRNAERISKQFLNNPDIHIPRVFWDYTTKKILMMEYVQGVKLNDFSKLEELGYSRKSLAEKIVKAIIHQILIEGYFHADPHPGNIQVLPGEVVSFLDFGMVGRLSSEMKYNLASIVIAMMRQNTDDMMRAILRMGMVPDDVNMPQLRRGVEELRDKYIDVPLSKISLSEAVGELFRLAFKHRIWIPPDLTLLEKSLLTLEGLVKELDPELSIMDIAKPFGRKLLKERFRPQNIGEKVWNKLSEYGDIFGDLPQQIKGFLSNIQRGQVNVRVLIPDFEIFLRKLDRMSNQISLSLVLLSLSILMTGFILATALATQPIMLWHIPALEVGFIIAGLMFVWLIVAIIKSGRF